MSLMPGTHARFALVALLVLSVFTPVIAAQSGDFFADCEFSDDIQQTLACMFLPADTTSVGPQEMLFGMVLPFLIVFAMFYFGMKQTALGYREAFVVALSISLFVIPSGGYQIISGFLFGLFQLFGLEVGPASVGGAPADTAAQEAYNFLRTHKGPVAVVAGIILALWFNRDHNIQYKEFGVILFVMAGIYLALGGIADVVSAVTWIAIFSVGFYLLRVAAGEGSGALGKLIGFVGIIVLGWGFTQLGDSSWLMANAPEVAQLLQQFGDLIFQGAATLVLIIAIPIGVIIWFLIKHGGRHGA